MKKELSELQKDTNAGVTVTPKGDQLTELRRTITGPDDTPYAGGFIAFPSRYRPATPSNPQNEVLPRSGILTLSSDGSICSRHPERSMEPALTIKTALLIYSLLCAPEPDDPQDAQVAQMYQGPRAVHKPPPSGRETLRGRPATSDSQAVTKLMEMGFGRQLAKAALQGNATRRRPSTRCFGAGARAFASNRDRAGAFHGVRA